VTPFSSLWWLWLALALLLGWHAAGSWAGRWLRRFAVRRRQQLALQGERDGARLLAAQGFRVLEAQVAHQYVYECDGKPHEVRLRADYLVERDGRRYLAEVKTGRQAPSLTSAATRRQLLEYAHAYQVDGVLLVNMNAGAIRRVAFAQAAGRSRTPRPWQLALCVALGALLAVLVQQLAA
jgi:hypothetical protein